MRRFHLSVLAALVLGLLLQAAPALAVLDLTGVTLDTGPVFTLAATVLIALGSIWAIRKAVKLINRS